MALYPAFHPVNRAKIVRKGLETKQSSRISRIPGNAGTLFPGIWEIREDRSVSRLYFISHTKSYNSFKFSTAVCSDASLGCLAMVLESKFLTLQKQWWAIVIFVLKSLIYCQTL